MVPKTVPSTLKDKVTYNFDSNTGSVNLVSRPKFFIFVTHSIEVCPNRVSSVCIIASFNEGYYVGLYVGVRQF